MSSSQFENPNPYSSQNPNPVGSYESGSSTQFTILGIIFLVLAVLGIGWSVLIFAGAFMQWHLGKTKLSSLTLITTAGRYHLSSRLKLNNAMAVP